MFIAAAGEGLSAEAIPLVIDATKVQRTIQPRDLGGTNIALWVGQETYRSEQVRRLFQDGRFGVIRLPGGSWSDTTFWNGHGVRDPQTGLVDHSRWKDGYPQIDYSAYAPTITVEDKPPHRIRAGQWHGNVDVLALHDFARHVGAQQLVCVNAGTGRPIDAAEWVKFANRTNSYNIRYWEIGNELDGGWEAGHFLADGSELTPQMYAQRFIEFARAMKQVDPAIRVGGPASGVEESNSFAEAILRDCGELVDFISIHSYPGNQTFTDEQQFARVQVVSEHVQRVRGWIEKYQPARRDEIEILYTEWNLPATRVACELDAALWTALFLREMAINGVRLSTQWDAFTQGKTEPGGHALIWDSNGQAMPKAQYWAMWGWNNFTRREVLASGKIEGAPVEYLATREGDEVCLMLVNSSRDVETVIAPRIEGIAQRPAEVYSLTFEQYFWNPFTHRPDTSTQPRRQVLEGEIPVAPFSLNFVRYPVEPLNVTASVRPAHADRLMLVMPESVYAGEKAEIWVRAMQQDRPIAGAVVSAEVSADGGELSSTMVRLAESAGRTYALAREPGKMKITARAGELVVAGSITVKPSIPRPVVIWDAEEPVLDREHKYESDFPIAREMNVRPNEPVVHIDLKDALKTKQNLLLRLHFPDGIQIDRSGIRGVFADVRVSPDFRCEDEDAGVLVLMQSESNWWMPIARFRFEEAMKTNWVRKEVMVTDAKHIEAMPQARNVWFILETDRPVNGSVYLDRIGLMVR